MASRLARARVVEMRGDEVREIRCGTFRWDPRGFIHATYRENLEMTYEDAVEAIQLMREMSGGVRIPVLVDGRGIKSQTRGTREYLSGPEALAATAAVAFIVGSPVSQVIGNFFIRQHKPKLPMKLFRDLEAAGEWLLPFVPVGLGA